MKFYSGYLIIIIEDLFDGIQPLSKGRVTAAYLEISSMIHRYNRFNCISFIARYIIQEIFEYRNIALTDTIAFTELGD